ncbi:MAG: hypothetical protein Ta2A_26530 [Treponemataceae bacterium]|nr:MAG: hypothetical protein Ta2A_26530 [Treponemataceae bacterium]
MQDFDGVLNFKEAEQGIVFVPNRNVIVKNQLTVSGIARDLRTLLFGPVIDKQLKDGTETDIRIKSRTLEKSFFDAASLGNISIAGSGDGGFTGVPLSALGKLEKTTEHAKIYRKDMRRAAFFTVRITEKNKSLLGTIFGGGGGTEKTVKQIKAVLKTLDMPRGYGFSFENKIENMGSHYAALALAFSVCILGMLILLTALYENPEKALLVVSIIPVSLSLPLLLKFIFLRSPLVMGDILGMVALAGISCNNAIYLVDAPGSAFAKLRSKIKPILLTSFTTIAGALPLFFSPSEFSQSLAFFMVSGTIGSLLASCLLAASE